MYPIPTMIIETNKALNPIQAPLIVAFSYC